MNILFLAPHPFYQDRGTPIANRLVLESLCMQHHRITILTFPEGRNVNIPDCRVVRLPQVPGVRNVKPGFSMKKVLYDGLMLLWAIRLVKEEPFDLVHAVEESVFIAAWINYRYGLRYVYDMDSILSEQIIGKFPFFRPFSWILERLERYAVQHALGVLPVCRRLMERVLEYSPMTKVHLLEDISLLDFDSDEDVFLPLDARSPIFMYVGNMESYQGIDLMLEGFQIARRRIGCGSLVLIGGHPVDIDRYQLKSNELGIAEHTVFLGYRPITELGAWLKKADVLVSPRLQGNNTPMKIYSYMDSGKPILATDLSTHTQVLNQDTAMLVRPDPEEMARGMVALMEDPSMGMRLASKAKSIVQGDFTITRYREKLFQFYDGISEVSQKVLMRPSA
jgi:glycosyltransferase involved in cell wall biosynthesis